MKLAIRKTLAGAALGVAALTTMMVPGAAHAGGVNWHIGINLPGVFYPPPPVIYEPQVVYAPPPVVYRQPPVYYQPAPIGYRAAPVYVQPRGHWHGGHWRDEHRGHGSHGHDRRDHRDHRDRDRHDRGDRYNGYDGHDGGRADRYRH